MSRCECAKESSRQSEYSPDVVQDDEIIVYALVEPLTSSVKAISKSGLKEGTVSVCRAGYTTGPEAKAKTVDVLIGKNSTRTDEGFLLAQCGEIRDIRLGTSNVGAFCVVDDGLPEHISHAHLGYSDPSDPKLRNDREAARANLLSLFNRRGVQKEWLGEPFLAA